MQMPPYTLTLSKTNKTQIPAQDSSIRYHVVNRGKDFVAISPDEGLEKGRKIQIRFVDNGKGYWRTESFLGTGLEERFDRLGSLQGVHN